MPYDEIQKLIADLKWHHGQVKHWLALKQSESTPGGKTFCGEEVCRHFYGRRDAIRSLNVNMATGIDAEACGDAMDVQVAAFLGNEVAV